MSETTSTLCFTCGQQVGEPPRLNLLGNGQVCPACRDRLLDALPSALPRMRLVPAEAGEGLEGSVEDPRGGWTSGSGYEPA